MARPSYFGDVEAYGFPRDFTHLRLEHGRILPILDPFLFIIYNTNSCI